MNRRPAFVLIEVMVVMAIISVLTAVFAPRILNAVNRSKAAQCLSNRAIIQKAEIRYRMEHDGLPSPSITALRDGNYLDRVPYCTAGGIYVWVSTDTAEVGCSVHHWPFALPTGPELLFSSGFDSMDMIEVLTGRWVISSDVLRNISSGDNSVSFGELSWTDYTVTLDATLTRGDGYGIYYRADGETDISGYVFQYDAEGGSFVVRTVTDGAESDPIASAPMPDGFPVYDASHQIAISLTGTTQEIYVDSVKVLTLTDSAYTSGSAGLGTWGTSRTTFDSVTVITG